MPGPGTRDIFAAIGFPMGVIFLLLTVSTVVATVFVLGFIWAVRQGQYDDDRSPAVRILMDDAPLAAPSVGKPSARQAMNNEPTQSDRP